MTFANFREEKIVFVEQIDVFYQEKLQFTAFFSDGTLVCARTRTGVMALKKESAALIFLRETLLKCPTLPCCNFEVGRHSRVGALEVTKTHRAEVTKPT